MTIEADTIAAIATAAGVGGVGIIRTSGPRAIAIAAELLGVTRARSARPGRLGARSRTASASIRCSRSRCVRRRRSRAKMSPRSTATAASRTSAGCSRRSSSAARASPSLASSRGARCSNGKLDLARAEALLDVIHAGSERALRVAQQNLAGRARRGRRRARGARALGARRDRRPDRLSRRKASAERTRARSMPRSRDLAARCAALAGGFRHGPRDPAWHHGRARRRGQRREVVAAQRARRSRARAGRRRARDDARLPRGRDRWDGVAVTLMDTAGTRAAADPVEARGIELGERRVAEADVVVVLNDGVAPGTTAPRTARVLLVVRSKADLAAWLEHAAGALGDVGAHGEGLDELMQRCLVLAGVGRTRGQRGRVGHHRAPARDGGRARAMRSMPHSSRGATSSRVEVDRARAPPGDARARPAARRRGRRPRARRGVCSVLHRQVSRYSPPREPRRRRACRAARARGGASPACAARRRRPTAARASRSTARGRRSRVERLPVARRRPRLVAAAAQRSTSDGVGATRVAADRRQSSRATSSSSARSPTGCSAGRCDVRLGIRGERRRAVGAARPRRRGHLRRAQPREHHRRLSAVARDRSSSIRIANLGASSARSSQTRGRRRLVVSETLFSMDGDIADVAALAATVQATRRRADAR